MLNSRISYLMTCFHYCCHHRCFSSLGTFLTNPEKK